MRPLRTMAAGPINLDHPGTYLHWSIFTVSVANLCLIAIMVVIFGAALLLPFPKGCTYPPVPEKIGPAGPDEQADARAGELAGRVQPVEWLEQLARVKRICTVIGTSPQATLVSVHLGLGWHDLRHKRAGELMRIAHLCWASG